MLRIIAIILFKITGWTAKGNLPPGLQKGVMVAAPHTSNWDIVYARAALFIMRIPIRFTIKKEWTGFPMGLILNPLGALPVDRNPKYKPKESMVDVMKRLLSRHEKMIILVTPEGTRQHAERWRTGFYHTAQQAQVPIVLAYLDYGKKEAGIGPIFHPTGDVEKDMEEIKNFYKTVTPKFPERGVY